MPEYVRVAEFEAGEAALEALVREISTSDGPPEGMNATRITVLADRTEGRVAVAVRFPDEESLRRGSEILEGMSPPDEAGMRRTGVSVLEVVLERSM